MPHSYTSIVSHLVFSTKNREPLIVEEIDERLTTYLGGIIRSLNGSMIASDGWFDHRHVLARHPANLSVSDFARLIKTNSSKWVHDNWPRLAGFGWQDGFGGFSVGKSEIDRVEAYVRNQKEHHRTETFEEEFVRFLNENEVEFDSKYLWPRKA